MPTSPLNVVIQHLLADLRPDGDGLTDGELLARFLRSRDEDALAALVRRHGGMVWGVCRRLLRNHHDAEDAFQATFLVLLRKAAVVPRQAVANWLYGVARQTAVRLRATAAKQRRRESQVVNMPEPTVAEVLDTDLQIVLDEELSRLPDHYRGVIVLCDLECITRREAARQLGIPEGSVASRLTRARAMLAKRLTQRGVTLSGGPLAAILSQNAASAGVPALLLSNTITVATLVAAGQAAATGLISVKVAALTEGVLKTMFMTKIKSVLAVVLVVAALSGAAGAIYQTQAAEQPKAQAATEKGDKQKQPAEGIANPEKDKSPEKTEAKAPKLWTLEGELKAHPKYLYRYYLVLNDGSKCSLYGHDHDFNPDQLSSLKLPIRVRVRGTFGTAHHPGGADSPFPETWLLYMDVQKCEVLK